MIRQFLKFGLVGVSNTIVGYVIYTIALFLLSPFAVSWDYLAANILSFFLSVLWAFFWNNRYVFVRQEGEERSLWRALIKMYISYGFSGLILGNLSLWLFVSMGIHKLIAPFFKLMITVPVNFLMNRYWTFRASRRETGPTEEREPGKDGSLQREDK